MHNDMLSIMIPAAPGSETRLRSLLSRITLAKKMNPEYDLEIIVCDGGSSDDSKSLCEFVSRFIPVKYIYVPIYKHINPSYPVNIMTRVSEGRYLCYMSVDYWPNENFLRVIDDLKVEFAAIAFGKVYRYWDNEKLTKQLLYEGNSGCSLQSVIKEIGQLHSEYGPMWAATREYILAFEGFYRDMVNDVVSMTREVEGLDIIYPPAFEAIHVAHEEKEKATIPPIVARQGLLTEYSFSIINGVSREPDAHELWIKDHIHDVESYTMNPVGEI